MNTTDVLLGRRSIRNYKKQNVSDEDIRIIINAGMYAPSAMNLQPWEFIIMNNKKSIDLCIECCSHGKDILSQINSAVLVCGNSSIEQNIDYIIQNCSAAVQNMLLQAYEKGLGTCWIGVYPSKDIIEKFRENFNLPSYILPVALIAIGFPDEEPAAGERYKSEKVHFNNW